MTRRLVTSSMMSLDFLTIYSWRHNLQSRGIGKLGPGSTIRVYAFKLRPTLKKNIVLKHERIRITTVGEEAFWATTLQPKFDMTKALCSESKALIDYLCEPFEQTQNIMLKISLFSLELWEKMWRNLPKWKLRIIGIGPILLLQYSMGTSGSIKA